MDEQFQTLHETILESLMLYSTTKKWSAHPEMGAVDARGPGTAALTAKALAVYGCPVRELTELGRCKECRGSRLI